MSTDLKDINLKELPQQLGALNQRLSRYRLALFTLFVVGVYGFICFQIFTLSSPTTDTSDVNTQVTSLTPHIDIKVVEQLKNLKDNSVNIQTLFDNARNNPFAE